MAAQQPQVVYVNFSSDVTPQATEALIGTMSKLASQRVPEVHLLLSTPGGSVMCGMNIYNVLKGMPFELVTHNVGNVDSIGNTIFLAGNRRYACPHSTFMFHGVGFQVRQPMRLEEKFLRERLAGIDADHTRIGAILAERSKLEIDDIKELFLEMRTKDAVWARDAGIVHEVRDVDIPEGAPVVALVFQRQAVGQ